MISRSKIEEVLFAARIEEVIGEFVVLKKAGRSFKGLSPFANEKTPSFVVSAEKQIFKDFSSGKGGNVISFLMEHEHFSYPEAIKWLAKKYSIEIEEEDISPEQKLQETERESLYIVTKFAEEFFVDQIQNTDEGKSIGLSYFKERGFHEETIEKFQLGYSPDNWTSLYEAAKNKGYKEEFLEKTGLIKKSSKAHQKYYDGYRSRVMFPIHNLSGRPIGFGGRILIDDKKAPKYINSPESLIYNKSAVLYGMYFAKGEIIKEDNCFLVEGYTDVISFHQTGIKNTVASSGTALTVDQIKLIKRYTKNITVLYDGDAAGIKASFRGIDMILEEGLNVKMVTFPNGEDPDSFAKQNSLDEVREFINKEAKDFIVSKTQILLSDAGDDPIKRAGLIKDIVESIALIPEEITRTVYIRECSGLLDINEKTLVNELNKIRRSNILQKERSRQNNTIPAREKPELPVVEHLSDNNQTVSLSQDIEIQERDILRILLNYGTSTISLLDAEGGELQLEIAMFILHELAKDEMKFENETHVKILNIINDLIESEQEINEKTFVNHQDQSISKLAVDLLTTKYELHDWWNKRQILVEGEDSKLKRTVEGALYSYKSKKIAKLIFENQEKMKESYSSKNEDDYLIRIQTQQKLDKIKSKLAKPSGRIILN